MNATFTLVALTLAAPPVAEPLLKTPQPIAARGDVKAGPPLVHTFPLTNASDGPVAITAGEAGCGCVRRAFSATLLKPGETATLTVEVNTLTQPDGPNRWPLKVRYIRAYAPTPEAELDLTLTATLSRDVTVTPPQLAFSTAGEATQSLTLADRRATPLTVTRAVASGPHLTPTVGPRTAGTQAITLKLAADAPAGSRDEQVTLYTDDPAYPEFRVPVRVEKRATAAAVVTPDEVYLRFAAGQSEASALVQVRGTDGKPVGVAGVECDHPSVTFKWSDAVGPVAAVRLTVPAAAATTPGRGTVRVRLSGADGPAVSVPVGWSARP